MNYKMIKKMLKEYDYEKNNIDDTVYFLIEMLHLLVNATGE